MTAVAEPSTSDSPRSEGELPMLKAVFFDLYGTIAGFEPGRFEVQSQACADFGITLTPEGVLRGYADADAYMNRENAIHHIGRRTPAEKSAFFAEYQQRIIRGSGVEVSLETADKIWVRIQQIPYDLAPYADSAPTLRTLRDRGLLTGLISNMDMGGDQLVAKLGLAGLFHVAVTSGDGGAAKPDPVIFRSALSKAGVHAHEAIHVGDQLSSDVQGALAVGIRPVLLDRDLNHPGYRECPRIESLTELLGLLEGESG